MPESVAKPTLNETDRAILRTLAEGRNTPTNIADRVGHSRQYVHQQMKVLATADYIRNIGSGVYELAPEEIPDDVLDDLGIDTADTHERIADLEADLARLEDAETGVDTDKLRALITCAMEATAEARDAEDEYSFGQALDRAHDALADAQAVLGEGDDVD